jgi:hypothetical protein
MFCIASVGEMLGRELNQFECGGRNLFLCLSVSCILMSWHACISLFVCLHVCMLICYAFASAFYCVYFALQVLGDDEDNAGDGQMYT